MCLSVANKVHPKSGIGWRVVRSESRLFFRNGLKNQPELLSDGFLRDNSRVYLNKPPYNLCNMKVGPKYLTGFHFFQKKDQAEFLAAREGGEVRKVKFRDVVISGKQQVILSRDQRKIFYMHWYFPYSPYKWFDVVVAREIKYLN